MSIKIAFNPLTINLKGTFDAIIKLNSARVATKYTQIFIPKNRDMINISVPRSFTRGSRLCNTDFV